MRALIPALMLSLAVMPAAAPVAAAPAVPEAGAGIDLLDVGIYCLPSDTRPEAAPETELGYINVYDGTPRFIHHRQTVPAVLGLSFGVHYTSDHDIGDVRVETWRPGQTRPDAWTVSVAADAAQSNGFTFETTDEMRTGTWRMEAWDGTRLLYRVEFDVQPADALPGIGPDCDLMS